MLIKIKFSEKLSKYLEEFDQNNKAIKVLVDLRDNGTEETNLIDSNNYVDYLNLKDDFKISYIKTSSIAKNNVQDPWHKSRQSCSVTQIIGRILNTRYMAELRNTNKLQQTDIEQLSAMCRAKQLSNYKVELLRGFDILDAYNYNGKIDGSKIISCANFKQKAGAHAEPKIKWFYPYIYNKNCAVLVVKDESGKIKARAAYFEGFQKENSDTYKKGVKYKFINNIYAEETAYSQIIRDYCNVNNIITEPYTKNGCLIIDFNCKYKTWPPVDYFYIDQSKNLLFTRCNNFNGKYTLNQAYKFIGKGGNHMSKNIKA